MKYFVVASSKEAFEAMWLLWETQEGCGVPRTWFDIIGRNQLAVSRDEAEAFRLALQQVGAEFHESDHRPSI